MNSFESFCSNKSSINKKKFLCQKQMNCAALIATVILLSNVGPSDAASSFTVRATAGMGLDFPCTDFIDAQDLKIIKPAAVSATATKDCSMPPSGTTVGLPFIAQATGSAGAGRVRARSDTQTGADLPTQHLSLIGNYPHADVQASSIHDFRILGPAGTGAQPITLRFHLSGLSDLGGSAGSPGVPWRFSGTVVNFGITVESQFDATDTGTTKNTLRDSAGPTQNPDPLSANVPHSPTFEFPVFLVPGKDYQMTMGLNTFAQGGALANYSSTGELQEVIVPGGYTLQIDGIPLRLEGSRYVLADAAPTPSVALSASPNPSLARQDVVLSASVTGNSPTGTIQFLDEASNLGNAVTLSGASTATFTTSALNVGDHTLTAVYSGDANNAGATSPSVEQKVNAVSSGATAQTITFSPLIGKTLGDAPFSVSATASSGLPVSFTSQTASVCSVTGSTVTILAVGTCAIRASQAGDPTYQVAPSVDQSFTLSAAINGRSGGSGGCAFGGNGGLDMTLVLVMIVAIGVLARRRKHESRSENLRITEAQLQNRLTV